jgi:hypothetical protein
MNRGCTKSFGDPVAMRFWDARASPDLPETERRIRESVLIDTIWHAAWVRARGDDRFLGMVNYRVPAPEPPAGGRMDPGAVTQGRRADALLRDT